MRRRVVVACLAGSLLSGCSQGPPPEQEFQELGQLGVTHLLSGRYRQAEQVLLRQHELSPENPLPLYNLACLHSMAGRRELALDYLERAADAGWDRVSETRRDSDLRPLLDEPRFVASLERMEENAARWAKRRARAHTTIDPDKARSYDSLGELKADFDRRASEVRDRFFLLGQRQGIEARWQVLDEKIAALRRYGSEHADAPDADEAALHVIETLFDYKEAERFAFWDQDGAIAAEAAEQFLERFPQSEYAPRAALLRARAIWFGRLRPASLDTPFTEEDLRSARESFGEVVERYPGTRPAGQALVRWIDLEYACSGFEITERVDALYAKLHEGYADDADVIDYAWSHAREPMFLMEGLSAFEGTDLQGNRWTLEALKGQVVLVDFWSTRCETCVEQLPELKRLYADYRGRGLQLIGVSLGEESAGTLSEWLAEHGVDWPQLHDGRGMSSELATRYNILDLPMGVVLDRDGRVVVAGQNSAQLIETAVGLLES